MFRIEALIREIETLSEGRLTSTPLCGAENLTVRTFAPLNHAAADTVAFWRSPSTVTKPRLRRPAFW